MTSLLESVSRRFTGSGAVTQILKCYYYFIGRDSFLEVIDAPCSTVGFHNIAVTSWKIIYTPIA